MNKKTFEAAMREHGRIIGKTYGSRGGKKAAFIMTPEQKRARALKANAASQEAKRRKKAAQQEGE